MEELSVVLSLFTEWNQPQLNESTIEPAEHKLVLVTRTNVESQPVPCHPECALNRQAGSSLPTPYMNKCLSSAAINFIVSFSFGPLTDNFGIWQAPLLKNH